MSSPVPSFSSVASAVEMLWARGGPGDDAAIESLLDAHPGEPRPGWLVAPSGVALLCALRGAEIQAAARLVAPEYWNVGVPIERLARAMAASTALVGACEPGGRLVATARAVSDGARSAWVGDVCVAPDARGRGLGKAVVSLLLSHPVVRDADRVRLDTRDAADLYAQFGFVDRATEKLPFPSTSMILRRR